MCSNNIISSILGISDKNLMFTGDGIEKVRDIKFKVLNAVLTYVPKACSKCGCVNENYSVVKNGIEIVKVILNRSGNNPLMLKIKKNSTASTVMSRLWLKLNLQTKGVLYPETLKFQYCNIFANTNL